MSCARAGRCSSRCDRAGRRREPAQVAPRQLGREHASARAPVRLIPRSRRPRGPQSRWLDEFDGNAAGTDVVGDQQLDELLAVDEPDERLVLARGLVARALAEVAGGDNEALVVGLEAARQRLHDRSLDVGCLSLGLNGDADDQPGCQLVEPSKAEPARADSRAPPCAAHHACRRNGGHQPAQPLVRLTRLRRSRSLAS
jgi:hypothetical protein